MSHYIVKELEETIFFPFHINYFDFSPGYILIEGRFSRAEVNGNLI
jgi:hypothetical protein